jgi:hypothetical protein
MDAVLLIESGTGPRRVHLVQYLDAERAERAAIDANAWIKSLRHAHVDGRPLRRRFTIRGDSLWWFAELYLHKQRVMLRLFETIAALDALLERERPLEITLLRGDRVVRAVAPQLAAARSVAYRGRRATAAGELARGAALAARAHALTWAAFASRLRGRTTPAVRERPLVAAFVHKAFWRAEATDGSAESYIGPVLEALEVRVSADRVAYVGVGPLANFRARRWWHPLRGRPTGRVSPIEAFAGLSSLRDSRRVWRERYALRRALWRSAELRQLATIKNCNCWPLVRHELAGIAFLQWPWSARAMDEAGAALDALRPRVVLTYAEAGGWGRAIVLECRRRRIPSAGIQHGFIYRHWLNYLHEPDEMAPDPAQAQDRGFPRPDTTLLFDRYAAAHLADRGRFPPDALMVTGSPRLDALARAFATQPVDAVARARAAAGAQPGDALLLLVTKFSEARDVLPTLLDAVGAVPGVRLAIKTHPAETPVVYEAAVAGRTNVRVLPPSAPLAPLLAASRAVITVNSTVALDAAVLDVPALVIGLPNNLSPFVDARVMAGASADQVQTQLERILYDEGFRQQLAVVRRAFLARHAIGSDGRAAERAVDAILAMVRQRTEVESS